VSLVLTDHFRLHDDATVLAVAQAPEQVLPIRPGREVRQARVSLPPTGGVHLVRVVVDMGPQADMIVTVYRTSKIDTYWRTS
jgi:hypothetical protein